MVGEELLVAAAGAAPAIARRLALSTTLILGPFLPAAARARVRAAARRAGADVVDQVDDLCAEIAAATVSVSQAGYNTTMDVLRAGRPAVVVPFAAPGEDEQTRRADRMARLGIWRSVSPAALTAATLADAVVAAADDEPTRPRLDLDGRDRSVALLGGLVADRTEMSANHLARSSARWCTVACLESSDAVGVHQ